MDNMAMERLWPIWLDWLTSCAARTMLSSICPRCKPAWPSVLPSRRRIDAPGTSRSLFDCPDLQLTPAGPRARVIVATHPATESGAKVGTTRGEVVYELFYTALPGQAFTPADVLALSLHRGASAPVLSDEDQEQEPDRWCSHTAWGQEFWLILAQWIWNLRLELGHALHPTAMRTTEFAPAKARSGSAFRRASTRLDASTAGEVRIGAMGTSFVYGRLSRFSFSPTTRWNAALPRRSSPLSTRTPTRTRRLAAGGVCRTSRSLSSMRAARAVSSIGNHPQSSAEKSRCLGLSLPVHRSQRRPHLQQVNLCLQWVLIQCVLRDWQRRFHRREVVKLLAQKPR